MESLFKAFIFSTCICVSLLSAGQEPKGVDSLRHSLRSASGKDQLPILNQLNLAYRDIKADSGLRYANLYYDLAISVGDSSEIVQGGRMQGYSLMDLARNVEAIKILKMALAIARRNSAMNPELKSKLKFILNNIGIAYTSLGNYDKSLDFHFQSLALKEEEGDKRSIITSLNNIAIVYYNLYDFNSAVTNYLRVVETCKELNDFKGKEEVYANLGLCYNEINKPGEGIKFVEEGFRVCGDSCRANFVKVGFEVFGDSYYKLKKFKEAKTCYLKSLDMAKKLNDIRVTCESLIGLGRIDMGTLNTSDALKHLKEAKALAEKFNLNKARVAVYEDLSLLYKTKNDYASSLKFREKYSQLQDSIYTGSMMMRIANIQSDYFGRENIRTINEKNQLLSLKEELINKQRHQTIFIACIAILLLMVLVLLYKFYKERLNLSIKLDQKVKERTEELRLSNNQLAMLLNLHKSQVAKSAHEGQTILSRLQGLCCSAKLETLEDPHKSYLEMIDKNVQELSQLITRI